MLRSIAEPVSPGSRLLIFKVLTMNVAICIVFFHFKNILFSLSAVADISNTVVWGPTTAGRAHDSDFLFFLFIYLFIYLSMLWMPVVEWITKNKELIKDKRINGF